MRSDVTVSLKRWRAALGLRGLAGGTMAVLACVVLTIAWGLQQKRLDIEQRTSQLTPGLSLPAPKQLGTSLEMASLPSSSQQTEVLRQIEESAQKLGLAWTKVDYSHQALSENSLASMDIKGVMRGPYPALRDFLAEVLSAQPSTALRSLILTRDGAESVDVEARISFSVFLADGWHPPGPALPVSAP